MIGLAFNGKNTLETYAAAVGTYSPSTVSSAATVSATDITLPGGSFNGSSPTIKQGTTPSHIVIVADKAAQIPDRTQDTWAYIGASGGATELNVFKDATLAASSAGWNGPRPPSVASLQYSIHGIAQTSSATANSDANNRLAVTRDANINKLVMIRPTLVQPSFTLGARFRSDDGSSFVTNYSGCKVSRAVFNFEEGQPVNFGADFIARDMSHNIGQHDGTGTDIETIKYKAEVAAGGSPSSANTVSPNYMKDIRVTEQPYFYSSVELTFQGVAIARFRRFTITIDNGLDPRYYITQNTATNPRDNRQILHEILEGRRNISFGGSIDLDDDGYDGYPASSSPTDAQFLRYLLNQGMTDADARDQNTLKGLGITVELRKVNDFSTSGSAHDKIKFKIPSNQFATNGTTAGQLIGNEAEVGMVLRSAPHNIPAPPSVHVPVDIDGMASSMHIEFMDGVGSSE